MGDIFLKYLERYGPYSGGILSLICGLAFKENIFSCFAATEINAKEGVSAVFDVMITLTAFLFSVFVLAIAPGGGFIERIFKTLTFKIFKRYVVEALALGTSAALLSVPFMATEPQHGIWNYESVQIVWGALALTASLAFLRVVHIFVLWIGYDAERKR